MSTIITSSESSKNSVIPQTGEPVTEGEHDKSASSESEESELHDENSETSDISEKTDEDEADSSDSENDEGLKDESKEDQPKKDSKIKKRFQKLTARATKAEQELEYWKKEALKGKTPDEPASNQTEAHKSSADQEPNPEDFETNAAFIKAYTKWEIAQEKKALQKESQQAKLKSEYEQQLENHGKRVNDFRKSHADYDQVVEDFVEEHGDIKFSPALEECIVTSKFGPDALYELLKDKEALDRLNSMSAGQAFREFGKLESKYESLSQKNPEVKTTKAPTPISPLGKGAASVAKALNDPTISFAEYEKQRMAQLLKK